MNATKPRNTKILLEYRDAGNFSNDVAVVFAGEITQEQLNVLLAKVEDHDKIIAHQVGLPTPRELSGNPYDEEMDHVWTTWSDLAEHLDLGTGALSPQSLLTDEEPTTQMSLIELVERFSNILRWDIGAEYLRMSGMPY